jgi:hypothetical protein
MRSYDDLLADLGWLSPAEMRLRAAAQDQPVLYALCMGLQAWDHVGRRDWRTRDQVVTAARHMVAAGTAGPAQLTETAVTQALEEAVREPAVLETDETGRYRSATTNPEFDIFGVGSGLYLDTMRARKDDPARLSPLEAVRAGHEYHGHKPADLDAAERFFRRAIDSGDPDAVAYGQAAMAELAETRERHEDAAQWQRLVFALNHPQVSPRAGLWLAEQAYDDGDLTTATALAEQLIAGGPSHYVFADAWSLRSTIHWAAGERQQALSAMATAIEHAGPLSHRLWARIAQMHAASGDFAAAVDAQEHVLTAPFSDDDAVGIYLQLMQAADRLAEAPARLRELAEGEVMLLSAGQLYAGVASAYAMLGDDDGLRQAIAEARTHLSARSPEIAGRLDLLDAGLAIAERDDERAAELFRGLVADGDENRQTATHPILLATGDTYARQNAAAAFEGARPLLEFLLAKGSPQAVRWASAQLAALESTRRN